MIFEFPLHLSCSVIFKPNPLLRWRHDAWNVYLENIAWSRNSETVHEAWTLKNACTQNWIITLKLLRSGCFTVACKSFPLSLNPSSSYPPALSIFPPPFPFVYSPPSILFLIRILPPLRFLGIRDHLPEGHIGWPLRSGRLHQHLHPTGKLHGLRPLHGLPPRHRA